MPVKGTGTLNTSVLVETVFDVCAQKSINRLKALTGTTNSNANIRRWMDPTNEGMRPSNLYLERMGWLLSMQVQGYTFAFYRRLDWTHRTVDFAKKLPRGLNLGEYLQMLTYKGMPHNPFEFVIDPGKVIGNRYGGAVGDKDAPRPGQMGSSGFIINAPAVIAAVEGHWRPEGVPRVRITEVAAWLRSQFGQDVDTRTSLIQARIVEESDTGLLSDSWVRVPGVPRPKDAPVAPVEAAPDDSASRQMRLVEMSFEQFLTDHYLPAFPAVPEQRAKLSARPLYDEMIATGEMPEF